MCEHQGMKPHMCCYSCEAAAGNERSSPRVVLELVTSWKLAHVSVRRLSSSVVVAFALILLVVAVMARNTGLEMNFQKQED